MKVTTMERINRLNRKPMADTVRDYYWEADNRFYGWLAVCSVLIGVVLI